ncbi:MAG: hypothetical protein IIB06_01730 [Bacteroidetes bacterium]|nr:hypothetical protein [Bacteroidota bacterium]
MSKQAFYRELLKEEKELSEALNKLRGLLKYYGLEKSIPSKSQKVITFNETSNNIVGYDKAWTYKKKVLFILKELGGSGLSLEVTNRVVEYDGTEKTKTGKSVRGNLASLYKKNIIGADLTGEGTKRRYYLKE